MRSLGENPSEAELAEIIRVINTDGNGTVEFSKFENIMKKRRENPETEEEYIDAFKVFDPTGSGVIAASQLKHVYPFKIYIFIFIF